MSRELAPNDADILVDLFPKEARSFLESTGADLIERLGADAVEEVIFGILCGENVRSSTEFLTCRRLAIVNAATIIQYLLASDRWSDLSQRLPQVAADGLVSKRPKPEKMLLYWTLGLTDKAFQNVLRDRSASLSSYAGEFQDVIDDVVSLVRADWGDLHGSLELDGRTADVDWKFALLLATAVGSQTLTIRGSDKSTLGKLFEKLVLGGLLHILGFDFVEPNDLPTNPERIFWLSSSDEKRESDGTLLFTPGRGVRFDIGFIGRGNPEITLDKVSRFEREAEFGRQTYHMATIILVDTIPAKSRLPQLAAAIDGTIVQMSMGHWPQQVARVLRERTGVENIIEQMSTDALELYMRDQLKTFPMNEILAYEKATS